MSGAERLQKILALSGLGSRRECEELIRTGRVSVNGKPAELGQKADVALDQIAVNGRTLSARPLSYIALYKPRGYASTRKDPHAARTVLDLLPPRLRHLNPVGRLDVASEGLMLLTNDGELANLLTHPRYQVPKTYRTTVSGLLTESSLDALREGVNLDDGVAKALSASVRSRDASASRTRVEIVMGEGRKREVRRMFEALGHKVLRLKRVRIGTLELGAMRPGEWRELSREETHQLQSLRPVGPAGTKG